MVSFKVIRRFLKSVLFSHLMLGHGLFYRFLSKNLWQVHIHQRACLPTAVRAFLWDDPFTNRYLKNLQTNDWWTNWWFQLRKSGLISVCSINRASAITWASFSCFIDALVTFSRRYDAVVVNAISLWRRPAVFVPATKIINQFHLCAWLWRHSQDMAALLFGLPGWLQRNVTYSRKKPT